MLTQSVAELSKNCFFQSEQVVLRETDAVDLESLMPELKQLASQLPFGTRGAVEMELKKVLGKCLARTSNSPPLPSSESPIVPRYEKYRHLTHKSQKVIRTTLGVIRCSVAQYRLVQTLGYLEDIGETEVRLSFVPTWWTMLFGVSSIYQLCITRLSNQGWNAALRAYNVRHAQWASTILTSRQTVSADSLIFKYCRDGNTDGVQWLISNKKASVYDMTVNGQTPLHVSSLLGFLKSIS